MDSKETALLALLAFIANLAFGLTSFGSSIMFQCGWHAAQLAGLSSGAVTEVSCAGLGTLPHSIHKGALDLY